jgi:hypothetical protein
LEFWWLSGQWAYLSNAEFWVQGTLAKAKYSNSAVFSDDGVNSVNLWQVTFFQPGAKWRPLIHLTVIHPAPSMDINQPH